MCLHTPQDGDSKFNIFISFIFETLNSLNESILYGND